MKKSLFLVLALVLVFSFALPAFAAPWEQQVTPTSIIFSGGGPYVIITKLESGVLNFKYGWNNLNNFPMLPVEYWIGVYDADQINQYGTLGTYIWVNEIDCDPAPKQLKLTSLDETLLIPGHECYINFFVRYDDVSAPKKNVAEISLQFIAL